MKKLICNILALTMLMTLFIPISGYAADSKGLEEAILNAKSKIDIPAEYEKFESSVSSYSSKTEYNLNWSKPDSENRGGTINISVNNFGDIISYNKYDYNQYSYEQERRLPNYSADELKQMATEWIDKVNPTWADELVAGDISIYGIGDTAQTVNFSRKVNGLDFCGNSAAININKNTGEVENFYSNWTYAGTQIQDPNSAEKLSVDDIQERFMNLSGLELKYVRKPNSDDAVLVYQPKDQNIYIDAFTGDIPEKGEADFGISNNAKDFVSANSAGGGATAPAPALTDAEISEISAMDNLISADKAKEIAESIENTDLKNFEVTGCTYRKQVDNSGKDEKTSYYVQIDLTKTDKENGGTYANVTLNAENGELINLYVGARIYYSVNQAESANPKLSQEQMEKLAKDFALKYAPNEAQKVENFDKTDSNSNIKVQPYNGDLSYFNFTQSVNGIEYEGNNINVTVDPQTGYITSFSNFWNDDINFEPSDKIITPEQAAKVIFDEVGFDEKYVDLGLNEQKQAMVNLVYTLKPISAYVSAISGEHLGNDLAKYKEEVKPADSVTDIDGHYAEDIIRTLIENNVIAFKGGETKFRPDDILTEKEALEMTLSLSSRLSSVYYITNDLNSLYDKAVSARLVDNNDELNSNEPVKRERAAEFIIRSLGYKEVAELREIFNCDFNDKGVISQGSVGYVAIARGLGIVNGDENGNFNPQNTVTRAEFAIMMYNYLTR